uniref:Uncharacterized protein n=1 Tax=Glossina austeni TaxID=7395 RepID=A0A1A9UEM3_GLOAU
MNLPPSAVVPKIGALHGPEPKLFKARTVTAYLVYFLKPLRVALVVAQPLTITDFNNLLVFTTYFRLLLTCHVTINSRSPPVCTWTFDGASVGASSWVFKTIGSSRSNIVCRLTHIIALINVGGKI